MVENDGSADNVAGGQRYADMIDALTARVERHGFFMDRDAAAASRDATAAADDATADLQDVVRAQQDALAITQAGADAGDLDVKAQDRGRAASARRRARDDRSSARLDRLAAAMDRSLSSFDDLTGAYRRDAGLRMLVDALDSATRHDAVMTLGFIDIDGLKTINDTHGHSAGDELLGHVVDVVKTFLRPSDPVVRFGGDEFLIGAVGLSVPDVAARLTTACRELRRDHNASFTFGLARSRPGDTLAEFIARADIALYRTRRAGSGDYA